MNKLRSAVEAGHIKPPIDRVYDLESAQLAHLHQETGRVKGKLVLDILHNN